MMQMSTTHKGWYKEPMSPKRQDERKWGCSPMYLGPDGYEVGEGPEQITLYMDTGLLELRIKAPLSLSLSPSLTKQNFMCIKS